MKTGPFEPLVRLRCERPWWAVGLYIIRAAVVTAYTLELVGMGPTAYLFYRAGHTLDFHWFRLSGPAGAPVFPVYRHVVTSLPVGFLFALVFWLLVGLKAWLIFARADREARGCAVPQPGLIARECSGAWTRALYLLDAVGACVFLGFFFYVPLANLRPDLRMSPAAEEVLCAGGLAGAALVSLTWFLGWLGDQLRRGAALVRGLFAGRGREEAGAVPGDRSFTPQRALVTAGASLLIADLVVVLLRIPFLSDRVSHLLAGTGLGLVLLGTGLAAWRAYREGLGPPGPP